MQFGAHVSAAGGLANAPKNAASLGLETFQFFSRPPQGGRVAALSEADAAEFRKQCGTAGFATYYVHAPYIINLAAAEERIRNNSIEILRQELERSDKLGATAMMTHIGSSKDRDEAAAIQTVVAACREILKNYKGRTKFLLEIAAGAGNVMGDTFEELKAIMDGVTHESLAICFDTAHAFASGYDLRSTAAITRVMKEFDEVIGLEHLVVSHCNDSQIELGGRKDRHEHIGDGHIGLEGFRAILGSKAFADLDLILETPPEGITKDLEILRDIRKTL